VNLYSFLDSGFESNPGDFSNYFGESFLSKAIAESGNFGLKSEIVHANKPVSNVGLGVFYNVATENVFAQFSVFPIRINDDSKINDSNDNSDVLTYFVSIDLPLGLNARSFGGFDRNGDWTYGEVNVDKTLNLGGNTTLSAGYNATLLGDGDSIPKSDHGLGIKFKKSF
jgi:hypothetical protein